MNKNRPVNLDISTIKLPITALVSILHRISGVILLAGFLILLWMLDSSLQSEESFNALKEFLQNPLCQIVLWGVLAALAYHTVMGIRHLCMDMGYFESLEGGAGSARVGLIVAIVLIVLIAGWLIW